MRAAVAYRKACDECSRRKRRCDGAMPCKKCIKLGNVCNYSASLRGKGGKGERASLKTQRRPREARVVTPYEVPASPMKSDSPGAGVSFGLGQENQAATQVTPNAAHFFGTEGAIPSLLLPGVGARFASDGVAAIVTRSSREGYDGSGMDGQVQQVQEIPTRESYSAFPSPRQCTCNVGLDSTACICMGSDPEALPTPSTLVTRRFAPEFCTSMSPGIPAVGLGPTVGLERVLEGKFFSSFCTCFNSALKFVSTDEINGAAWQMSKLVTGNLQDLALVTTSTLLGRNAFFWAAVALGSFIEGCEMERVQLYLQNSRNSLMECFDDSSLLVSLTHAVHMCLYDLMGNHQQSRTCGLLARVHVESQLVPMLVPVMASERKVSLQPSAFNLGLLISLISGAQLPSGFPEQWSPLYSPVLEARRIFFVLFSDHKSGCSANETKLIEEARALCVNNAALKNLCPLCNPFTPVNSLLALIDGDVDVCLGHFEQLILEIMNLRRLVSFSINVHSVHVALMLCVVLDKFETYKKLASFYDDAVRGVEGVPLSPPFDMIEWNPCAACPQGLSFCLGWWDVLFGPRDARNDCSMIVGVEKSKRKLKQRTAL